MDHAITIATRQAPIDTLEPPTMGTLYRWECSCGTKGMSWRATKASTEYGGEAHLKAIVERVTHAASDLLAALHALVDDCSDQKCLHLISLPVLLKVEAAIDKAEGR